MNNDYNVETYYIGIATSADNINVFPVDVIKHKYYDSCGDVRYYYSYIQSDCDFYLIREIFSCINYDEALDNSSRYKNIGKNGTFILQDVEYNGTEYEELLVSFENTKEIATNKLDAYFVHTVHILYNNMYYIFDRCTYNLISYDSRFRDAFGESSYEIISFIRSNFNNRSESVNIHEVALSNGNSMYYTIIHGLPTNEATEKFKEYFINCSSETNEVYERTIKNASRVKKIADEYLELAELVK